MKVFVLTKKRLAVIFCCFAVFIFACCITARSIAVSTASQNKLLPIYCVETNEKKVCLTFDAAWGNEDTEELIKILASYNAKATFFLVGEWVDKYPESVKALSEAGHSIQNHSDTHAHLPELSSEEIKKDIQSCNDKIKAVTGKCPTLLRAPYGDYNNTVIKTMEEMKMYTIQWDVDSLDWKDYEADKICDIVLSKVGCGSIILFHNAALHTPEALPKILDELSKQGYEFVTVEELIYKDGYEINHEGRQIKSDETKTEATSKDVASQLADKVTLKYLG